MRLRGERDLLSADLRAARTLGAGPLLVLLGASLWGTAGASQALLGPDIPSALVGALRTVVASIVVGVLVLRGSRAALSDRLRSRTGALLLVAGVSIAAYQVSFFIGVRVLGIAVGTILAVGSAPLFAGSLGVLTGTERPTRARVATTLLAVAGLAALVRPDNGVTLDVAGVVAALTAGLSFGGYTVLARALLADGLRRIDTVAVPFGVAGLLLLPVLARGIAGLDDPTLLLAPRSLAVVLWLGAGATAVGYLLFIAGLRDVAALAATTLVLAEPLTATLLGVLAFDERLGPVAMLGAAVVGVALMFAARTTRRSDTAPAR